MGKGKIRKTIACKTVSIRYRFVFESADGGEPCLKFLPHPLITLKVDPPKGKNSEEILPENVVFEDDIKYLRSLVPKEWKCQDHYKVLGIPQLRFKATEDIIKAAHRNKVLKHHPDKRKEVKKDDDYFTCITMAYAILGDASKRRAYDSVDPQFDNTIPSSSDIKKDFYATFQYYFELNSRWSEKPNVPQFGDENSTRAAVDDFYTFWYNFKSWREYSYEDEEDRDKCGDRDERRYADKLNKAERLRKKKEEMVRIRKLLDLAYNNDQRITKFRKEDAESKMAAKRAKLNAAQAKRDEEEKQRKEAILVQEQAEAAERARAVAQKKEREAQKKALKRARKSVRDTSRANKYFAENTDQGLANLIVIEDLCKRLSLSELEELHFKLTNYGKLAFMKALEDNKDHQDTY